MTKYQLAKLILMAGGLRTRKRIQKTVHLLQAAGCPLDAEFRMHFYGPYSQEVAGLLDEMSTEGILTETAHTFEQGARYDYEFSGRYLPSLQQFEATLEGQRQMKELLAYEDDLRYLASEDVRTIELAATMVLFRQSGRNWQQALQETCDFKKESPVSPQMIRAEQIARKMLRIQNEQDREDHP